MYASSATAPGWAADPEPATLWTTPPGPDRFTTRRQFSGGAAGRRPAWAFPARCRDPDHVRPAKVTSAADTLTRTPPGTTLTDLTARCSGRPVTGTTKRNCPAITLDSELLPDATETRVGITAIPVPVADSAASADTGTVTPR